MFGNFTYLPINLCQLCAGANHDVVHGNLSSLAVTPELANFTTQILSLQGQTNNQSNRISFKRLLDVVIGTHFQCFDSALYSAVTGNNNDQQSGINLAHSSQNIEPALGPKVQIKQDQVDIGLTDFFDGINTIVCGVRMIAILAKNPFKILANKSFIIHNQNTFHKLTSSTNTEFFRINKQKKFESDQRHLNHREHRGERSHNVCLHFSVYSEPQR